MSTTITRTETNASIRPEIRFDIEYLKTINGYLKVALLVIKKKHFYFTKINLTVFFLKIQKKYFFPFSQVLFLINVIIINSSRMISGASNFFNTIAALAFFFTAVMLTLYLFHIPEKFYTLPWLPVEIGGIFLTSLLYFIASLMTILQRDGLHTTAGVFGFITTGVYFYSGYLKYKQFKSGELAQGTLLSRSQTTSSFGQNASAFPA